MVLDYEFYLKNGIFKYNCFAHGSYIEIRAKDIKKIYEILSRLDSIYKQSLTTGVQNIDYGCFTIVFDFDGNVKIKGISNWLRIKGEVPIIKGELSKYIKKYDKDNVKDIIIKIKSLNKGSSNIIKEDLKWEKLLFQEK